MQDYRNDVPRVINKALASTIFVHNFVSQLIGAGSSHIKLYVASVQIVVYTARKLKRQVFTIGYKGGCK